MVKNNRKEYNSEYYKKNKERMQEQNRAWKKANPQAKKKIQIRYQVKSKMLMLNYLGGAACHSCGYDKYYGALEFHHVNPEEKELKLSETHSFTAEVKRELEKCVILCANCHREVHANLRDCPPLREFPIV